MKPAVEVNSIRKVAVKNNHLAFRNASVFAASKAAEHQPTPDPERTSFFGIGLCVSGSIILQANLHTYHITPGTLITISPYTLFYWEKKSEDYQVLKIFFEDSLLLSFLSDQHFLNNVRLFGHGEAKIYKIEEKERSYFTETFTAVTNKIKTNPINKPIAASNIAMLLSELGESISQSQSACMANDPGPTNHKQQLVLKFKEAVAKDFLTNRSVKKYAALLYVSPSYLGEVVKEIMGKSPTEVIEEMTLLEAKMLLRRTELTISEIADRLNYYDASFFTKFFKSRTGLTPKEFRKK